MGGVLFGLDLGGVEASVRAHFFAHGRHRAFQQPLGGVMGLAGEIVERHRRFSSFGAVAPHNAAGPPLLQCVFLASRSGISPPMG